MAESQPPHLVAVPMFAQGHINPMMELCKQLAVQGGCAISFVTPDLDHQRILRSQGLPVAAHLPPVPFFQNEGLHFHLLPLCDGSSTVSSSDAHPPVHPLISRALSQPFRFALRRLLLRLRHDHPLPISCVLSDIRLLVTQDVANELGIPRVGFWTQSASSFASHLIFARGYPGPAEDTALVTCIPGAPPHEYSQVSEFLRCDPSLDGSAYAIGPFRRIGENALVLINTFDELEKTATAAMSKEITLLSTGPSLPSPFFNFALDEQLKRPSTAWTGETVSCLDWLDTQSPASVLYVSFGTLAQRSPQQLVELVHGLEASEQPFLWVFRADLTSGNSDSVLDDILRRTKHRSLVVPWAPQLNVLSHPSVGGFLSHCGWNATLESITTGVPVLTWPTAWDQPLNAVCMVEGWKMGLKLETDESGYVQREEVEKKVKELIKGEMGRQARENILELREAARRAIAPGGSSKANLELFLDWLKKLTCTEQVASHPKALSRLGEEAAEQRIDENTLH